MCATSAFVVFLCFLMPPAATAPWVPQPDYDLIQPAALRSAAARRLARGDEGTALILRERADVLAGSGAEVTSPRNSSMTAADLDQPALPALWPSR